MEDQSAKTNEPSGEFQNFTRLAKGLFAVPKTELDEKIREENKRTRRRTEVKPTIPKK